jgi:hypothetical protein
VGNEEGGVGLDDVRQGVVAAAVVSGGGGDGVSERQVACQVVHVVKGVLTGGAPVTSSEWPPRTVSSAAPDPRP